MPRLTTAPVAPGATTHPDPHRHPELPLGAVQPDRAAGSAAGLVTDESPALASAGDSDAGNHLRAVPGNTSGRLRDLEGYRGLAALGIVVYHAYQFTRASEEGPAAYAYEGTLAYHVLRNLDGLVSLFLILSAFLLFAPIARRILAGEPAGSAKAFAIRRAVRILPLYWGAILVVWASRNPVLPGDWRDLLEHLTFTQVFDNKRIFYTIGPAWSLSVEVFFYLFLAVLYLGYSRLDVAAMSVRQRWSLVLAPVAILGAGSFAYLGWALATGVPADQYNVWFSPMAKGFMFAAGMVLGVVFVSRDGRELPRPGLLALRGAAIGLIVAGVAVRTEAATGTTLFHVLSTAGLSLLLASSVFADTGARWRRTLARPELLWAGLISYSVYLWHEPVLLFLDGHGKLSHDQSAFPFVAGILLVLSLLVGWISYWVVEYPATRLALSYLSNGRRRDYYPHQRHRSTELDA